MNKSVMHKLLYSYIIFTILLSRTIFSQTLQWHQLQSPVATPVTSVTQLSNGEFYLDTKTRGVYKSTDNGSSWMEFNTGIPELYINRIYSTDDDKLFACGRSGIFQFNWQTQTWVDLHAPQADFVSIVVNSLGHIIAGSNFGIFRTEDNGNTWQAGTLDIGDIGTVNSLVSTVNNILFAGATFGVYKSVDNGVTWTYSGFSGLSTNDIFIDNGGIIYANMFYRGQGIYRSQDLGKTWEQVNDGITDQIINAVIVDKQGSIYVGTTEGGVFKKRTDQPSFTQINLHQSVSNVLCIYIAQDNSLFICSESGGLFKKNETGLEFEQLNSGLPLEHAFALGSDSNNNFYLGNFYTGIHRKTQTSNTWFPIAPYLGGSHRFTFLAKENQIYLGTTIEIAYFGMLFKSTDQGESWYSYQDGFPTVHPDWPWTQVVMDLDVNSSGDLFAALNTKGIYRRLANDIQWSSINSTIPDTNALSVCVNSYNIVFAGFSNGRIYKSADNGESWVESFSGIQDYTVEILKSTGNYVFAILHNSNYPYHNSDLGLYSDDNGITWFDLNVSNLGSRLNSINLYNNIIVAGTDNNGAFISYDFGKNWISANSGLSNNVIRNIVLTSDGLLFCGTEKEGIYVADLKKITQVGDKKIVPSNYSLEQNYPNPFNPSTRIKYSIPRAGNVQIIVYDLLGRKVKTILSGYKRAGTYEIEFDGKDLPSGVYLYRLQAENLFQSKKMILLR